MTDLEHTTLFGGKVTVWQPMKGYRFAMDSLVLAAFTHPNPGDKVLELGIGVGAASLALAYQHPDIIIHGVEVQDNILPITHKNIEANGWADRFELFAGSLRDKLIPGHFYDHVMMNPPFFERQHYSNSLHDHKTISHGEGDTVLEDWIYEAHRCLISQGYLTIVHCARRLDDLLTILSVKFAGIEVFPLWPRLGHPAKRVLIRARKGVKSPLTLHAGLVLHQENGALTPQAAEVIHKGHKLKCTRNGGLLD